MGFALLLISINTNHQNPAAEAKVKFILHFKLHVMNTREAVTVITNSQTDAAVVLSPSVKRAKPGDLQSGAPHREAEKEVCTCGVSNTCLKPAHNYCID
jgi:hypothetical protein